MSYEELQKQIDWLNTAFMNIQTGQANSTNPFQFRLAGWETTVNDDWFVMVDGSRDEYDAKYALRKGGPESLNIYILDPRESGVPPEALIFGWADAPSDYAASPIWDGVVINYRTILGGYVGYFYVPGWVDSTGDVLVRLTGQWLGLWDTSKSWSPKGDGCNRTNDEVEDTPQVKEPSWQCVEADTCPRDEGNDPIHNFMSITTEACMDSFTLGQTSRMNQQYTAYRHYPAFIDGPKAITTSATSATIVFETTEKTTTGLIEYGLDSSYGSQISTGLSDTNNIFNHTATIVNLSPGTEYHYRVTLTDHLGNTFSSDDQVFTTSSELANSPINCTQESTALGWKFGSIEDIRTVDKKYEILQEILVDNKRSVEHTWTCPVNRNSSLILGINGYGVWQTCTEDKELDYFIVEYSTNGGANWNPMTVIKNPQQEDGVLCTNKIAFNGHGLMLPQTSYGEIKIRVRNKDRTYNNNMNKLYVDYVGVLSTSEPKAPRLWAAIDADEAKGDQNGLYWSDDLGVSWNFDSNSPGLPNYRVSEKIPKAQWKYTSNPLDLAYRYASESGVPWTNVGQNLPTTIEVPTDEGPKSLPVEALIAFSPHPESRSSALVALRSQILYNSLFGGPVAVNLYRTMDAGATWQQVDSQFFNESTNPNAYALAEINWDAVDSSPASKVVVLIFNPMNGASYLPDGGYLISPSAGFYFYLAPVKLPPWNKYVPRLSVNNEIFYAKAAWNEINPGSPGNNMSYKRSTDNGNTWENVNVPIFVVDYRGLQNDLTFIDDLRLAYGGQGTDNGFYRSLDGGETWNMIYQNNVTNYHCSPSQPRFCVGSWVQDWRPFPRILVNYDPWRWSNYDEQYLNVDMGPPLYRWFGDRWYSESVRDLWLE